MKTSVNNTIPEIDWTIGDLIDKYDHETHYEANGLSSDGKKWQGTWIVIDGQINEIHDIEEC